MTRLFLRRCADDKTVKAVGHNSHGQLGDGTTTDRSTAVTVSGVSSVSAIAAGGGHTVFLLGASP